MNYELNLGKAVRRSEMKRKRLNRLSFQRENPVNEETLYKVELNKVKKSNKRHNVAYLKKEECPQNRHKIIFVA